MPGPAPFVPQHGEQPEKPQWSEQKSGQGTRGGPEERELLPVAPHYDHAEQQVADGLSSEPPAGREVGPRKQRRRNGNARTEPAGNGAYKHLLPRELRQSADSERCEREQRDVNEQSD